MMRRTQLASITQSVIKLELMMAQRIGVVLFVCTCTCVGLEEGLT